MEYLKEIAEIWKEEIEKSLVSIGLKDSNIIKNVQVQYTPNELTLLLPEYSQYIESGRKPGSFPPYSVILKWVKRKKFTGDLNGIAYSICKAIQKRGIKPRPFIQEATENAENRISLYFDENLDKEIEKILSK